MDIDSVVKDYQSGSFKDRPSQPVGYKSKTKQGNDYVDIIPGSQKWYTNQLQWMFWMYSNNYTNFNYSTRQEILTNRLYANAMQPIQKYLAGWSRKGKDNRSVTWANISFDINPILPKFINWVLGGFNKVDYNVIAKSVSESAGMEREAEMWSAMVEKDSEGFYEMSRYFLDDKPKESQLPFVPSNKEQMQMLVDMGFVKLKSEATLEELMRESADLGRWEETIKPKLHRDSFVDGWIWTRAYTDPVSKKILPRYVDPANLVVRFRQNDYYYQQISYVGEIVPYTIGDLRANGIKGEDLMKCLKYYGGKIGNLPYMNFPTNITNWNPIWDDYVVYVLEAEFEAIDFQKYKWIDFEGITVPEPMAEDETPHQENPQPMTQYPKWHRAKSVLGTNVTFDYGFQFNVPYEQDERPQSTFSGVRVGDRSAISLIIADADYAQNLTLKQRAALAKLRPPGTIWDRNALKEIEVGGKKFNWLDQIDMFNQTGDALIENPITPTGQAIPGVPPPYYDNPGSIGILSEYRAELDAVVAGMAGKLGIPTPIEGSAPNPNTPVTTTQIALEGTNNILRPMLMAYQSVKKQTFGKIAYMYEIRDKADMLENYTSIVGNEGIDLLKLVNQRQHGIHVDAVVDEDTQRDLMQSAQLSLQAAKTGSVGISNADYFAIQRLVQQGLYKSAQLYLMWKEEKNRKEQEALQAQNMELNKQMALETEEAKRETVLALDASKAENKIQVDTNAITLELKKDMELLFQQGIQEIQKTILQGKIDEQLTHAEGEVQKDVAVIEGEVDVKVAKEKPQSKPAAKK